jgi:N-acetylglucosamine malate deacetylase 2
MAAAGGGKTMLTRATLPEARRSNETVGLNFLLSRKREQKNAIVCISAHPGEELLSMGGSLIDFKSPRFIQITEGSPRDVDRALQAGFECRDEYAQARKREFAAALRRAGLEEEALNLGYEDGEVCENLAAITMSLAAALHESEAELIITHPYEGVHPDFDGTAFAVQCACELLENDGISVPVRIEAAGACEMDGRLVLGRFLTERNTETATIRLDPSKQRLKRSLLECLRTQQEALQGLDIQSETFRIAPVYDFSKAPHDGVLRYEADSQMSGRRWRKLAAEALRVLGLADHY